MKLVLALVLLLPTAALANDNAAEAFATGFANAMNRSMGGREYQAPPMVGQPSSTTNVEVVNTPHYDAVTQSGTPAGLYFATYSACVSYSNNAPGWYGDCVFVNR